MNKKCLMCGKDFNAKPNHVKIGFGKYCSQKCYFEHFSYKQRFTDLKNGLLRNCLICNKEFKIRRRDIVNNHGKCCSRKCAKLYYFKENPDAHKMSNHPGWTGRSSLELLIRRLPEYIEWRNKVFRRDGFTCEECKTVGGSLEAHHVISFSYILKEFVNKYNQFSIIEDKEILARLSLSYELFWDINNGKTLCKKCHSKTDSYLTRKSK